MHTENVKYMRDMARDLAKMAETEGLSFLAYIFRMAEEEANQLSREPLQSEKN
jgi:hypothetical protein